MNKKAMTRQFKELSLMSSLLKKNHIILKKLPPKAPKITLNVLFI